MDRLAEVLRRLIQEPDGGGGAGLSNGERFYIASEVNVTPAEYRELQRVIDCCHNPMHPEKRGTP